jgi:hypothetical protein
MKITATKIELLHYAHIGLLKKIVLLIIERRFVQELTLCVYNNKNHLPTPITLLRCISVIFTFISTTRVIFWYFHPRINNESKPYTDK